jgi:hypothetical protein
MGSNRKMAMLSVGGVVVLVIGVLIGLMIGPAAKQKLNAKAVESPSTPVSKQPLTSKKKHAARHDKRLASAGHLIARR